MTVGSSSFPPTTIYGLSTEGYNLASTLALRGANVSVVDDSAGMAISVKADVAKTYQNVSSLIEDGPLLAVEPIDLAIRNATYIFFAPRIRKTGTDVKIEVASKFQDAIKHLKKNSSIIYTVPVGLGNNLENIALVEHITGLKIGTDIHYYYMPLTAATSRSKSSVQVGTYKSNLDTQLVSLLSCDSGVKKVDFVDISSLEILHSIQVLERYSGMACTLEICRGVKYDQSIAELKNNPVNDIYLDDVADGLYDLRAIGSSVSGASPLIYMVNGAIKSIEAYTKHLIDETRMMLKRRDLKASRTKVIIAWTIDQNQMRGDKLELLTSLENRLKDYIGEVEIQQGSFDLYPTEKTTIVIACSRTDLNNIVRTNHNSDLIIVKAIPILEIVN